MKFNINDKMIIYPNKKGWEFIKERLRDLYGLESDIKLDEFMENKITHGNGFKEHMWCIIENLPELFYQSSNYIKTTVCLVEELIKPTDEELQQRLDQLNNPKHPWNWKKTPEEI